MAVFIHETVLGPGGFSYLAPVGAMISVEIGGDWFLITGSSSSYGMTLFGLDKGQTANLIAERGPGATRGTYGLSDLDIITVSGTTYLLPSGDLEDSMALHRILPGGAWSTVFDVGSSAGLPGPVAESEVIEVGGQTYLYTAAYGADGLMVTHLSAGLSGSPLPAMPDTSATYLGRVTAMTQATIGSKSFIFAASGTEDGLQALRISPSTGELINTDTLDASDGFWGSTPNELISVVAGGTTYLIAGSAGSNSLTVVKVANWGGMSVTDHEVDTLATRFQDTTALDATKINHRVLVTAGGSDDGISLFELSPSGLLLHLETVEDTMTTTLQNVAAIETVAVDEELQVFVSSETEPGVTQFTVDLGNFGVLRRGGTGDEWLNAIWADDLLDGFDGNDVLKGNSGADTLIDGPGQDRLYGGNGADRFVFVDDDTLDIVKDFNKNQDVLDLSEFDGLYGIGQLELIDKPYGVYIRYEGEGFRIEPGSGTLTAADLTAEHFIF